MAFKLKSGNKPGFKNMGSSPAKDMKTGSYKQSFESPAKQIQHEDAIKDKTKPDKAKDGAQKNFEDAVKEAQAKKKSELTDMDKEVLRRVTQHHKGKVDLTRKPVGPRVEKEPQEGSSPAKQIIPLSSASTPKEKALQSKIAKEYKLPVSKKGSMPKNFNMSGKDKWVEQSKQILNKSKMPKNFNMTGKDSWVKRSKEILKKSKKGVKKVGKKAVKGIGGRAFGVLGLLGAGTLNATATNPHIKKPEGQQIKDLLTKHKLKGGKN